VTKKIIEEWKQVDRMKQLNQRLYDELDVALMFTLEYAERNNIVLPNRDRLSRMVENIHNTTNAMSITVKSTTTRYQRIPNNGSKHPTKTTEP
jgi:hypothetical protein